MAFFRLLPLFGLLLLLGCEGFFGRRTETDFLDVPVFDNRTVAYVPVLPVWRNLSYPTDVIAGFDELIYVADSGSQEIISFDQAGNELGRFGIPGLRAIAQDRRLNILATGTAQRQVGDSLLTLAAIYRLDLNSGASYGLREAVIDTVIVHPNYFRSGDPVPSNQLVRFTGISVTGSNDYYVSRTGPVNIASQFGGPDNSVHLFNAEDEWIQNLLINSSLGQVADYFRVPTSLGGLIQPPQLEPGDIRLRTVTNDFLFTSADPAVPIKAQYIQFDPGDGGGRPVYRVREITANPGESRDYLYRPDRFIRPIDVAVGGDGDGFIFVLDAGNDSLYQFSASGQEGVRPPAGSNESQNILVSFGGRGQDLTQFQDPRAVAYMRGVVYVADAGNGRILRFQLTTEFDQ